MAHARPDAAENSTIRRAPGRGWRETRPEDDFRANLLSPHAVWAEVRRLGPGEPAVSWVAARQFALITTAQLTAAGVSKDAIAGRRRRGTLHRVHHGVYLYGSPLMLPGARELAAVLACGDTAVISHRSAAKLWRLAAPGEEGVDVTVVAVNCRRRRGLTVHRLGSLPAPDRAAYRGIPVTSPARTLLDFATQAVGDELERAVAEAYALGLASERDLAAVLKRNPRRPGAGLLRAELAREGGPAWTRSEAERRMKMLLRQARLPSALVNVRVGGWPADFLWPQQKLIVEVDGYRFHGHRQAFERDRRRDAAHVLAGYRVIRVTWRQLVHEPLAVAVTIARALALAEAV